VEVLDTDIDRVRLHTRLLARAREWEPTTVAAANCFGAMSSKKPRLGWRIKPAASQPPLLLSLDPPANC
ncbi:MAG TPA: hypothetical protein VJ820_19660, partial [Propionibacteriaceae bacterium]|nr:hypothetical protein [Propionibacteriaceae bacterium]